MGFFYFYLASLKLHINLIRILVYNIINNNLICLDNTGVMVFSQNNVVHGSGYLLVGRKCEAQLKLPHE